MSRFATTIKSIPRWVYITLYLVFFTFGIAFGFWEFNSETKDAYFLGYQPDNSSNINNVSQKSKASYSSSTNQAPALTPEAANAEKDNQSSDKDYQKQNINPVDVQINKIDTQITAVNDEINHSKSQIEYQHSQIKNYQQNHNHDIQNAQKYDDPKIYKDTQQANKSIQDANDEIARLQGVISNDQQKITDLNSQKQSQDRKSVV